MGLEPAGVSRRPLRPGCSPPHVSGGLQRRFHAMVKPFGSACNLACDSRYYLHQGDVFACTHYVCSRLRQTQRTAAQLPAVRPSHPLLRGNPEKPPATHCRGGNTTSATSTPARKCSWPKFNVTCLESCDARDGRMGIDSANARGCIFGRVRALPTTSRFSFT